MSDIKLQAHYRPQSIGLGSKVISFFHATSDDQHLHHHYPKYTAVHKKPIYVNIDRQRVQQCLINIQSNALKFTDEYGRIDIYYTLYKSAEGKSYLEFQVRDTGTGIKEEDQEKLFKLFGFIQTTQDHNTRGIGLGLSISKKIINKFGGEIGVKSKWEKGSTFSFCVELE